MDLTEFSFKQEQAVRRTAARLFQYACLNPTIDVGAVAKTLRDSNPLLRGVSVREITAEFIWPGSFSNG